MKRFQFLLILAGFVMLALVLAQPVKATIATQQAQIGFTIIVNVTPSPMPSSTGLVYVPEQAPATEGRPSIGSMSARRLTSSLARGFQAENLQFEDDSTLVAQAQVQNPLLVQAEVTPNPKATILYTDVGGTGGNSVTLNQTAGTTVQYACAFTVTVDMTTAWSLEQGLSNDFASGFPGKDLANDTYKNSATPLPTSTPYVVYADDSSEWSLLGSGSTMTTYCVTLTLTVPGTTSEGTYSTNAIFTLFN